MVRVYATTILAFTVLLLVACSITPTAPAPRSAPPPIATVAGGAPSPISPTLPGVGTPTMAAASISPPAIPSPLVTGSLAPSGVVVALLANNQLIVTSDGDGALLNDQQLAPPPAAPRGAGQYLGLSADGKRAFALVPDTPDRVVVIALATGKVQSSYRLPTASGIFRSLVVGRKTGRLFLIGNTTDRNGQSPPGSPPVQGTLGVDVIVLDPTSGAVESAWTAPDTGGYGWEVFQAAVSDDERHIFVSYHGINTTGIDRFTITARGLERCHRSTPPNVGCLPSHGPFVLHGDSLFLQRGDDSKVIETDYEGGIRREIDTRVGGNHMLTLAIDPVTRRLYALGDCWYTPGFSATTLTRARASVTPVTGGDSTRLFPARTGGSTLCGHSLFVSADSLVIIGQPTQRAPDLTLPGRVLLLDSATGKVVRSISVPAVPISVLATPAP